MKRTLLLVITVIALFTLVGCGGGADQSTPEGAARIFVKGMINDDSKMVDSVNRSGMLDFPTHHIMSGHASLYAGYSEKDFTYEVNEKGTEVTVTSSDGKIDYTYRFERFGDKYYFTSIK